MSHNAAQGGRARRYLITFAPMVILTLIAFGLTMGGVLSFNILGVVLLVMAAVQFFLQVFLFMHLDIGRRAYMLAFGAGVSAALIISLSLFILLRV